MMVTTTVAVAASIVAWLAVVKRDAPVPAQVRTAAQATAADLAVVTNRRVFFGHQSVGQNIISGVSGVFAEHSATPPEIVELTGGAAVPAGGEGGLISHAMVGQNRFPESKLEEFANLLRTGMGKEVEVAILKFCYLDVDNGTDVDELFELYRSRMAELAQEFPDVRFIYATVPLRTEATDLKQWVKELIGRPNDNAARERFNRLVRAEYADTGRLFDIAAIQSTEPDGTRVTRTHKGVIHFALFDGYASDPGHLNQQGSVRAASEFLALVARSA